MFNFPQFIRNYAHLKEVARKIKPYLVQEGMLLDAATAVEDDRLRDEAADQEHQAVDHVKLE